MSRPEPRSRASNRVPAAAAVFAALGDPTRLSLLTRLSDGEPRSISALSTGTRLTRQAVTKHLRVLERVGLVASGRVGRESHFAYRPERLSAARAYLDRVAAQWDDVLGRIKAAVEER
jgi:DNA-binding transcriptional ArsR family regulator